MKREIIITDDGSTTIHIPEWNEQYHSTHGAIQEAYHVFIKNGLSLFKDQEVNIMEIGFGTGLNCLITYLEAEKYNLNIDYVGVEAYPISNEEKRSLNYISEFSIQKGFTLITAEYIPTKKNIIVKDLYKKLGFLATGNKYQLKLNNKLNLETKIKIKDE